MTIRVHRGLFAAVFLLAVFVSACLVNAQDNDIVFPTSELTLHTESGDYPLMVEVATSSPQRQRGLMYRTALDRGHGMIFDFGQSRPASMWMANTLIPLDMVFIRADGTVSGFHEQAEPESKAIISSSEPVRYVLEIGGGEAEAYGLKPGDTVSGPTIDK